MIDFIRIHYKDKRLIEPHILDPGNFLDLDATIGYHSNIIKYPFRTKINCLDVNISEKAVTIKNSLHKLHNVLTNNGVQNHNDFNFSQLCNTIDYLSSKLIDINEADITQLEFGLNLNTSKSAEKIIIDNIYFHKLKLFDTNKTFNGKGFLRQFNRTEYIIKVYDKAKQYRQVNNILRFEIKFIKKRDFNKLGIVNINDLKSVHNIIRLYDYLIQRFNELTIVDNLSESNNDFQTINTYLDFNFWRRLDEDGKRNSKYIHKKKFESLLEYHNLLQTKKEITTLIKSKFNHLINN